MTNKLSDLLYKAGIEEMSGSVSLEISNICFDSRKAEKGSLFIAVKGTNSDGHDYINDVIAKGAVAVVCERFPSDINRGVCYVRVKDSSLALAYISANFYNNPSASLTLVGITGTNGKTTTATLLYELYKALGYRCGLLSTVNIRIAENVFPATHTTPDPLQLNYYLREMVESGCTHCFMEVSSHAIVQHRIAGLEFKGAVFTNITRDHLDYHKTFDEYIKAKKGFFDLILPEAFALINSDDRNHQIMVQNTKGQVYTYAMKSMADFKVRVLENNFSGLLLQINKHEVHTILVGTFNAYNILAAYAVAVLLKEDEIKVLTAISSLLPPEGRFENIISTNGISGIIDYAHTPDALENVLLTIRDIRTRNEQLITVVGCGGDRDKGKRPQMAAIACEYSDRVILTSDNPRSENPEQIIAEMRQGVPPQHYKKVLSVTDRKEAVRTAVALAKPGDIILLAGKGHEKYQEIQGVKHPFDDKQVLEETLSQS